MEFALNKFIQNLERQDPRRPHRGTERPSSPVSAASSNGPRTIRQKDITDFLRYKNGLLSAVFMFTRYPELKSVIASHEE